MPGEPRRTAGAAVRDRGGRGGRGAAAAVLPHGHGRADRRGGDTADAAPAVLRRAGRRSGWERYVAGTVMIRDQ